MFARDPDAILDMRELNVNGLTDKYRAEREDACGTLTGWEVTGTLREFAPPAPKRIWFDYPVHVTDNNPYLAVANYSDSGTSGRGTGEGQKERTDWLEIAEDLIGLAGKDTAVSLEAVGTTPANAKKVFSKDSDFEVATVGDAKVVHRRSESIIVYLGEEYKRIAHGSHSRWIPSSK